MRFHGKVVLAAGLLLTAAITGCPGKREVASSINSSGKSTTRKDSPEDLLHSAVHQLRPENFDISAATDKPVALLNSWSETVNGQSGDPKATNPEVAPIPTGWIDEKGLEKLKQQAYDPRDAVHIRDAMLTHTIANYLAARGKTELQRVMAVFDFVVRNISFRGPNEVDLPLGTYRLLLLGKGTAEDRACVCASLLKQLRIDCVIVESSDSGTDPDTWLLGVVLNDQVYLFDPRLGLAIPSTDDLSQSVETPATLDQIVDHGEWLKRLSLRADQPYAIDAESLKQPRILPIADSYFWPLRMKLLEEALPANDLCVLYDPLVDDGGRKGLLTRLTTSIRNWKVDQLQPWPHPQRAEGTVAPAIRQQVEIQLSLFNLPFTILKDEQGNVTGRSKQPERKMLRIRTDQLLGNFEEATKRYFSIRHLEIDTDQLQVRDLAAVNQLVAEDAIYWSAVCKYEAREFDGAIEQLNGYLKRYDRNGRWNFPARALLGECYAGLGKFSEAAAVLERSTRSDDPYRASNAIRIKRWNARAAKTAPRAESK
jgi:tetratricopeptide (TPR) repeat protein